MSPTVVAGEGDAARFVESVRNELAGVLGFRPYAGTLNVDGLPALDDLPSRTVRTNPFVTEHCDGVTLRECSIGGVRGAVLRPLVGEYPEDKVELLAPVRLRSLFALEDGTDVAVAPPSAVWHPESVTAHASALNEFDGVVFDLDGTLVDLDVDWDSVHAGIEGILADVMEGSLTDYTRPGIMALAREHGRYGELEALLAEHEDDGAETAARLPLLDRIGEIDRPVGICTANASSAADRALRTHGVREQVDAVVGRDTLREGKPHPRPLERCLDALGVSPGNSVFVGDERTDGETAVAAGSSFLHPAQLE